MLEPGADAAPAELQAHTRRLVAGYKVPRGVEIVDSLPPSGAGKVIERDLRARLADPTAAS